MNNWRIGTMGFGYKPWVGPFYPAGMQPRSYLAHYSQHFNAVEIDSTFYGTPRSNQVQRWHQITPPDFIFCAKTPRAITHDAPLSHGVDSMRQFLEVMGQLESKLGVILIQFGPAFSFTFADELDSFLQTLPNNFRYAVEFRHRSWDRLETAVILRTHNVCWTATDYIYMSKTITRTTDFLYLRFIGPHGQYQTKDRELVDKTEELQGWNGRLQPHLGEITACPREGVGAVYSFFNNDYSGHSPTTCNRFKKIVGEEVGEIRPLTQGRLF